MSKKLLANVGNTVADNYRRYYQEYEGTFITATDKSEDDTLDTSRYIEVAEIWGNTVQDENNLEDIQSVGELQEDGTYKMSILSCGKNLLKIPDNSGTSRGITFTSKDGLVTVNGTNTGYVGYDLVNGVASDKLVSYGLVQSIIDYYNGVPNFINKSGNYTIKADTNVPLGEITFSVNVLYDDNKHLVRNNAGVGINNPLHISVDSHINGIYIGCWYNGKTFNNVQVKVQIEEGTVATSYEPYQENKCDILLPCQLQKVGDVYDRLYWDSEKGKYVVEKNILKYSTTKETNYISLSAHGTNNSYPVYTNSIPNITKKFSSNYGISSVFGDSYNDDRINVKGFIVQNTFAYFRVGFDYLDSHDFAGIKKYLQENLMDIYYQSQTPELIETNITEKILLPCYSEKTHIFVNSTVDATMKVLVPYKEII